MDKIQNMRRSLPGRIAVGVVAVIAGVGMAPAVAADELSAEAEARAVGPNFDLTVDSRIEAAINTVLLDAPLTSIDFDPY